MIRGTLVGSDAAVERLGDSADAVRAALAREVQRIALDLLSSVKADKLSGQVLNVRTGRLRRSINQRVEVDGDAAHGFVGTNVEYARYHEFGFSGTEDVRSYFRKCKSGKVTRVRAHTRTVDYPEHSFLRSALAGMQDEIKDRLRSSLRDALKSEGFSVD